MHSFWRLEKCILLFAHERRDHETSFSVIFNFLEYFFLFFFLQSFASALVWLIYRTWFWFSGRQESVCLYIDLSLGGGSVLVIVL